MNKKIISLLITFSLLLFSILYISKSKDIVKNIDPLMEKINSVAKKYEVKPIDAVITDNKIILGISGKTIDKNVTYSKMKKYGAYNESLISVKNIKPKITIDNYYDKYIISGNDKLKNVSLVFKINELEELLIIKNYLDMEHLTGTLLLNNKLLESNEETISKLNKYEIELYFDEVDELEISQYSNYLDSITNKKNKYCITDKEEDDLLKICKKYKMHTVIPNIVLDKNPTSTIKKELSNGSIILISFNEDIRKELDYIIYYIKTKGYNVVSLSSLLRE